MATFLEFGRNFQVLTGDPGYVAKNIHSGPTVLICINRVSLAENFGCKN
jgi:hypothetical protein